jgi:magnesium-protoporphyrin O-methyltransferase
MLPPPDARNARSGRNIGTRLAAVTEPEPERCCFDEWVDHWEKKAGKRDTVAGVSAPLLDALTEAGLAGRTVLDVGCGIGDLALAALERGATRASGVDLSPKAIEEAGNLAKARGLAGRASFQVGDGSTTALPRADVVVLNRVVCCYPDADALLERSLAAAGNVFAFTAPASRGLPGLLNRIQTGVGNLGYRMRRKKYGGFRVFVHDVDRIDEQVRGAGFRPVRRERSRVVWDLAVYAR